MKFLKYLLLALPFLLTCQKEEDGNPYIDNYNISGTFNDGTTGDPIEGVSWAAYTADGDFNDAWNGTLSVGVHVSGTTTSDGSFDFTISKSRLGSEYTPLYFGCTSWPEQYQHYFDVNGQPVDLFLDRDDYYANREPLRLINNNAYQIKMFRKASFRFVLPTITQALKQDTLELNLSVWNNNSHSFALGNADDRAQLTSVRELKGSDRVSGYFKLRNGVIKQQGQFDIYCTPDIVTEIYLDL